jgi:hypothetical protein
MQIYVTFQCVVFYNSLGLSLVAQLVGTTWCFTKETFMFQIPLSPINELPKKKITIDWGIVYIQIEQP